MLSFLVEMLQFGVVFECMQAIKIFYLLSVVVVDVVFLDARAHSAGVIE